MIGPSMVAAGAMDVYGEAKFNQLYVDIELVLVLARISQSRLQL